MRELSNDRRRILEQLRYVCIVQLRNNVLKIISQALKQRERKRELTEFKDPKYDAAFTINAMSDYEDDPERIAGEPTCYIARAPEWRSTLVSKTW